LNIAVRISVFIPACCLPSLLASEPCPALSTLMARSRHAILPQTLDALICRQAGIPLPEAGTDLPLAAICRYGEQSASVAANAGEVFLFADPVHLALQRDAFSLVAPVPLPLAAEDSADLLDSLNSHFVDDGLEFIAAEGGHWILRCSNLPRIHTWAAEEAVGRDVREVLPAGPDAAYWRQVSNEIQMLLHVHPVNAKREALGELPCNSVWFWGGGVLPLHAARSAVVAYGASPLLKGLAAMGLLDRRSMPLLPEIDIDDEDVWLVFDDSHPADEGWFSFASRALRFGHVECLSVYFGMGGRVLNIHLSRIDLWKFWRKQPSLADYFER
jgi:hypothetical protein